MKSNDIERLKNRRYIERLNEGNALLLRAKTNTVEKTRSFNKHNCAMQSVENENAALRKSIAGVTRMGRRLQKEHDAIATECEQGKASCC
jgi:hypothetical protein